MGLVPCLFHDLLFDWWSFTLATFYVNIDSFFNDLTKRSLLCQRLQQRVLQYWVLIHQKIHQIQSYNLGNVVSLVCCLYEWEWDCSTRLGLRRDIAIGWTEMRSWVSETLKQSSTYRTNQSSSRYRRSTCILLVLWTTSASCVHPRGPNDYSPWEAMDFSSGCEGFLYRATQRIFSCNNFGISGSCKMIWWSLQKNEKMDAMVSSPYCCDMRFSHSLHR